MNPRDQLSAVTDKQSWRWINEAWSSFDILVNVTLLDHVVYIFLLCFQISIPIKIIDFYSILIVWYLWNKGSTSMDRNTTLVDGRSPLTINLSVTYGRSNLNVFLPFVWSDFHSIRWTKILWIYWSVILVFFHVQVIGNILLRHGPINPRGRSQMAF